MWSHFRKMLLDRLAESLNGRVDYGYFTKRTNKIKYWTETPVFYIRVDGKDWFTSDPRQYSGVQVLRDAVSDLILTEKEKETIQNTSTHSSHYIEKLITKHLGYVATWGDIENGISQFLTTKSIDECLSGENYFLYLLAILDRRVGKRRIRKIAENINSEPKWIRKFINLRAEAEGIHCTWTDPDI